MPDSNCSGVALLGHGFGAIDATDAVPPLNLEVGYVIENSGDLGVQSQAMLGVQQVQFVGPVTNSFDYLFAVPFEPPFNTLGLMALKTVVQLNPGVSREDDRPASRRTDRLTINNL